MTEEFKSEKMPNIEAGDSPIKDGKLFTFKDIDGNEQYEAIEDVNKFYNDIKAIHPSVVAVSIVGSTVKGYARSENSEYEAKSDIDLCVILDDSNAVGNHGMSIPAADIEFKLLPKFNRRTDRKYKLEFHGDVLIPTIWQSIDRIRKYPTTIAGLLYPYVGDVTRMNQAIEEVRDIVRTFTNQEQWAMKFAESIVENESISKAVERKLEKGNIKPEGIFPWDEYRNQRIKLYYERIKKLFID